MLYPLSFVVDFFKTSPLFVPPLVFINISPLRGKIFLAQGQPLFFAPPVLLFFR